MKLSELTDHLSMGGKVHRPNSVSPGTYLHIKNGFLRWEPSGTYALSTYDIDSNSWEKYQPPPKPMDFASAMNHLAKGKPVRRNSWPDGLYVRPLQGHFFLEMGSPGTLIPQVLWSPTGDSLVATDWVVA